VIDIPTASEPSVRQSLFIRMFLLPPSPVWRVATGAESHNFNYWPPEADDPLPAVPNGFGGFA
jgi:hypothetical protein